MKLNRIAFPPLIIALLAIVASGQAPTIDQSLSLMSVSGPRISPDGRFVAYQVQETNWEENAFETEIWIVSVESGDRYQLTNAKKSSSNPQWSPDSRRIRAVLQAKLDHIAFGVPDVAPVAAFLAGDLGGREHGSGPGSGFATWQWEFTGGGKIETGNDDHQAIVESPRPVGVARNVFESSVGVVPPQ